MIMKKGRQRIAPRAGARGTVGGAEFFEGPHQERAEESAVNNWSELPCAVIAHGSQLRARLDMLKASRPELMCQQVQARLLINMRQRPL